VRKTGASQNWWRRSAGTVGYLLHRKYSKQQQ